MGADIKYIYLAEFVQTALRFVDGLGPFLRDIESMAYCISIGLQPRVEVDNACREEISQNDEIEWTTNPSHQLALFESCSKLEKPLECGDLRRVMVQSKRQNEVPYKLTSSFQRNGRVVQKKRGNTGREPWMSAVNINRHKSTWLDAGVT